MPIESPNPNYHPYMPFFSVSTSKLKHANFGDVAYGEELMPDYSVWRILRLWGLGFRVQGLRLRFRHGNINRSEGGDIKSRLAMKLTWGRRKQFKLPLEEGSLVHPFQTPPPPPQIPNRLNSLNPDPYTGPIP